MLKWLHNEKLLVECKMWEEFLTQFKRLHWLYCKESTHLLQTCASLCCTNIKGNRLSFTNLKITALNNSLSCGWFTISFSWFTMNFRWLNHILFSFTFKFQFIISWTCIFSEFRNCISFVDDVTKNSLSMKIPILVTLLNNLFTLSKPLTCPTAILFHFLLLYFLFNYTFPQSQFTTFSHKSCVSICQFLCHIYFLNKEKKTSLLYTNNNFKCNKAYETLENKILFLSKDKKRFFFLAWLLLWNHSLS